ncbi:MAG: hypothetical protein RMK29_20580 [Myxococcales bacterium]|nr:hypothetical protein [Myxococcota bacterium]MDW8284108.1 hypothetical protein [Myxococcales bacterium]
MSSDALAMGAAAHAAVLGIRLFLLLPQASAAGHRLALLEAVNVPAASTGQQLAMEGALTVDLEATRWTLVLATRRDRSVVPPGSMLALLGPHARR